MGKLPVEDQLEIQDLYSRYNLLSDAADSAGYANCFTADGTMLSPEVGIEVRGHDALVAHKERDKSNRAGRYRRHWNANLCLDLLDDGRVCGRCYLLAYNGIPKDLPTIADCGVYEDILVKVDGAWKFESRCLSMDGSTWNQGKDAVCGA
ncbi:MAG: hypothetical protein CMM47_03560 [Rhodospirillaceae bacterium]|nr:hypothetical protein [Rhodospirillaceae bacterium]